MRGFVIALTFLTRLPFPSPKDVSSEEFTHSYRYYPGVGLVIGLILWLLAKALIPYYPPLVLGAILLAAELMLTGGIHLDGFMDSMDGLLSARSPEQILEIMKDSRVGAHASMALVGLLLLKFTLLASLTSPQSLSILIVMPMLSRWVFQIGMIGFPYARSQGLGKGFHEATRWIPFLLIGMVVCGISFFFAGVAGLIAFGVSILTISVFASRVSSLLGGLTGDLYGAFIEVSEVVCLLVAFPFLH
ncbi:adenosylcobinamide-GDP ribazoletransferase [Desulfosporosinus sp. Sb-LF]|uniref:adenosylcobinamide-GDP ribazoletransferase n=1 Tax=Desulfosporosinus sp. Sb-LF TaxID=2560027 RepID=UPI00107FA762|nr:adenosylcobinamide-GDP ribazoletransferase [Desulfosporosinus sp. Sb-LF]TGE34606.1 adenosylcobinamide-GDP ribazoletransferase [Desulfosporosinus sp. Sb-LF]